MPKVPGVQPTPWTYQADDYRGKILKITVNFTQGTGALLNAEILREVGCVYSKIYFGLGPDGKPESSTRQFTAPEGTTPISKAMLNSGGLNNISDVLAGQVTAGP